MPSRRTDCTKCGSTIDVVRSWCRECRNRAGRERYHRDPDHARQIKRESMRRIRANHPEKVAQWNANKAARWAEHYGPRQRVRLAAWKVRHFFAWRARIVSRYGEPVTAGDLASLWRRQRGRCALTGRPLDRSAEIDHILPRSRGGSNGLENLRWVCEDANQAKRGLTDVEFLALCRDVAEWIGRRLAEVA